MAKGNSDMRKLSSGSMVARKMHRMPIPSMTHMFLHREENSRSRSAAGRVSRKANPKQRRKSAASASTAVLPAIADALADSPNQ